MRPNWEQVIHVGSSMVSSVIKDEKVAGPPEITYEMFKIPVRQNKLVNYIVIG